ncbi:hypothetical protein E2C01_084357 [Portunus trituberculatus]|uniref:Uncharacterized protein n=1 Tax=Portunus trituberculatus TaxID=210409 RepID=A0A5B7J4L0_PORTR|nr:hypothetical protein [Portunus trituberculatus]
MLPCSGCDSGSGGDGVGNVRCLRWRHVLCTGAPRCAAIAVGSLKRRVEAVLTPRPTTRAWSVKDADPPLVKTPPRLSHAGTQRRASLGRRVRPTRVAWSDANLGNASLLPSLTQPKLGRLQPSCRDVTRRHHCWRDGVTHIRGGGDDSGENEAPAQSLYPRPALLPGGHGR